MNNCSAWRSVIVVGLVAALLPFAAAAPSSGAGPLGLGITPQTGLPESAADPASGWQITDLGAGRYDVSWTAPQRLPMASDRPTIGAADPGAKIVAGPPIVGADGRTVSTVITSPDPLTAADLDVVLSGDRLDEPGQDLAARATGPLLAYPPAKATGAPLPTDPGAPGPYATKVSDYKLDPVVLPPLWKPVEMMGHVVEPAPGQATGLRPLVLFLHGKFSVCYNPKDPKAEVKDWPCRAPLVEVPSHLGYTYLQQLLASQGYTTVSIRANGIAAFDNSIEDGGAAVRAQLVQKHLDYWTSVAGKHNVDLSKVTLVGHSRGGEGVNRASMVIPLNAPYRIIGEILLGPTNFSAQTAPYVPTVAVLPECDGDVADLEGQMFVDNGRDLVSDDNSLKSSVLMIGANHNYFNTEWTPGSAKAPAWDDWKTSTGPCGPGQPGRLSARQQRQAAKAVIAGAVHVFNGDNTVLPLFDGTPVRVPSLGTAKVFSHAIGGGRDLRRPGSQATRSNAQGMVVNLCRGMVDAKQPRATAMCGAGRSEVSPHWMIPKEGTPWRYFARLRWGSAGGVGGLALRKPLDVSRNRLELRTIVDGRTGPAQIAVRLTDNTGAHVDAIPLGGGLLTPPRPLGALSRLWARTVAVNTAGLTGINLAAITKVEVVARSATGGLWIADVSAAPATLPEVREKRLPIIDYGDATVREGNGPGLGSARVPFRITGEVTEPATVVSYQAGDIGTRPQRVRINIAPGQTEGSVRVNFPRNRLDNPTVHAWLTMWALRGIVTNDYDGRLYIVDDDPDAKLSIQVSKRVREGEPIVIWARLTAPSARKLSVSIRTTSVESGAQLSQHDLPGKWRRKYIEKPDPNRKLSQSTLKLPIAVAPGQRVAKVVIPTVRDRRREGVEKVRFKILTSAGERTFVTRVIDR